MRTWVIAGITVVVLLILSWVLRINVAAIAGALGVIGIIFIAALVVGSRRE